MNEANVRYGGTGLIKPLKRLRLGPFSADLMEDGSLKYLRLGATEIMRHVHLTVRDRNWGTVPGEIFGLRLQESGEAVRVAYRSDHRNDEIDFGCAATIEFTADGRLTFAMEGEAKADFLKNRLGLCLLHPMEMAGAEVSVVRPDGVVQGRFPERVSPEDPFSDMQAMTIAAGPVTIDIRFEGELFQTEDQRNWTDGSFKTFCTPLHIPYPVRMEKGMKVRQSVTIAVSGRQEEKALPLSAADDDGGAPLQIKLRRGPRSPLPALGSLLPPISGMPAENVVRLLEELGLSQLRCAVDLSGPDWRERIAAAAKLAEVLRADWELELAAEADGAGLGEAASAVAEAAAAPARIAVFPARALPVPETRCELSGASLRACRYVTNAELLRLAKEHFGRTAAAVEVGGGSRGNFSELNRVVTPAPNEWDFVEFAINPQVHASDLSSIAETLPAQGAVCRTAASFAAGLPVRIGAVTLKQRLNPYAADDDGVVQSQDRARQLDPRQQSLFAAGWTIGSIAELAAAGAASVNYYEAFGPLGLMAEDGSELFPVYGVMKAVGGFRGGELLPLQGVDPFRMAALAVCKDGRAVVLLANLTNDTASVELDLNEWGGGEIKIRTMAGGLFGQPARKPAGAVELAPFGVYLAELDGSPDDNKGNIP